MAHQPSKAENKPNVFGGTSKCAPHIVLVNPSLSVGNQPTFGGPKNPPMKTNWLVDEHLGSTLLYHKLRAAVGVRRSLARGLRADASALATAGVAAAAEAADVSSTGHLAADCMAAGGAGPGPHGPQMA